MEVADAIIRVKGRSATLVGGSMAALTECCSVDVSGDGHYNAAFRNGRGDGRFKMHDGRIFPAGFIPAVRKWHRDHGAKVSTQLLDDNAVDRALRIDRAEQADGRHIEGTLLPDQLIAVKAVAMQPHGGRVSVPTAGGKTYIIAAIAAFFWHVYGWRSLCVTSRKGIAKKNAAKIAELCPDIAVGQFGDGVKRHGEIVSASAQSLINWRERDGKRFDPEAAKAVRRANVILLDECHHAGSESWYRIAMEAPNAVVVVGLTGTMDTGSPIANLRLEAACGPIVYEISARELIDGNRIREPFIAAVRSKSLDEPGLAKIVFPPKEMFHTNPVRYRAELMEAYREAEDVQFSQSARLNEAAIVAARWLLSQGRRPCIIVRKKAHFLAMAALLRDYDISAGLVWGDTPTRQRDEAYRDFTSCETDVLLASTGVISEGEDIPAIDALVVLDGGKAPVATLQKIGRAMRKTPTGPDHAWIIDLMPDGERYMGRSWFKDHAVQRVKAYRKKGYNVIQVFKWPGIDEAIPSDLVPFPNVQALSNVSTSQSDDADFEPYPVEDDEDEEMLSSASLSG